MKKLILDTLLNILIGFGTVISIEGTIYLLKNAPSNVQVIVNLIVMIILLLFLSACLGAVIRMFWGVINDDSDYYPPSY